MAWCFRSPLVQESDCCFGFRAARDTRLWAFGEGALVGPSGPMFSFPVLWGGNSAFKSATETPSFVFNTL